MWPFKPKDSASKLQYFDPALNDLSKTFLNGSAESAPGNELLDASRFDYSVASLAAMDEHLEKMRGREWLEDEYFRFVLQSGAYVGEVIRQQAKMPHAWHWLDYKQSSQLNPTIAGYGTCLGTSAILWRDKDLYVMPLNKVEKYLLNGAEDSVLFYTQAILALP